MTEGPRGGEGDQIRRFLASFRNSGSASGQARAADETNIIGRQPVPKKEARGPFIAARNKAAGDNGDHIRRAEGGNKDIAGPQGQPADRAAKKEEEIFPRVDEPEVTGRTSWRGRTPEVVESDDSWVDPELEKRDVQSIGSQADQTRGERGLKLDAEEARKAAEAFTLMAEGIETDIDEQYEGMERLSHYSENQTDSRYKNKLSIDRQQDGSYSIHLLKFPEKGGLHEWILEPNSGMHPEDGGLHMHVPVEAGYKLSVSKHTDPATMDNALAYQEDGDPLETFTRFTTTYFFGPEGDYIKIAEMPSEVVTDGRGRMFASRDNGRQAFLTSPMAPEEFEVVGALLQEIKDRLSSDGEPSQSEKEEI